MRGVECPTFFGELLMDQWLEVVLEKIPGQCGTFGHAADSDSLNYANIRVPGRLVVGGDVRAAGIMQKPREPIVVLTTAAKFACAH